MARATDHPKLADITLTAEHAELLTGILNRLEDLEAALEGEGIAIAPTDITDPERQQYDAAQQWMGDFIVAVRGYLSSDLAEGGELAAMKDEMRSRVMNMLARGRPW